ncbi:MAG: tRNA (adenosine(37)-N6)-dimethylallyltransferase MiaA [Spirochaetota bacterium]
MAGPTGAGKTALSLELCSRLFPSIFEIISADSVQIYRYMDIGSGKLSVPERCGIPHYMINEVDPDFHFDASEFCIRSAAYTEDIISRGKIPCFVGGTGMYLESFFKGLSPVPAVDPCVREQIMRERAQRGDMAMHKELSLVDPESAGRIHPNDWQRTLRALQVFRGTGETLSSFRRQRKGRESEETLYIGIGRERGELDRHIEKRVDGMIASGFLDEVSGLRAQGYTTACNSMRSIGYQELSDCLDGLFSLDEAVEKIKKETRDYSRRQYSWFRRYAGMKWFDFSDIDGLADTVAAWIGSGQKK